MKKLIVFAVISFVLIVGCAKKADSFKSSRFWVPEDKKVFTFFLGNDEKPYPTEEAYKATLQKKSTGDLNFFLGNDGKAYRTEAEYRATLRK